MRNWVVRYSWQNLVSISVSKGLFLAGAALILIGAVGGMIAWSEYWLRSLSPSSVGAATALAIPSLFLLTGVAGISVGTVRLARVGSVKRYTVYGALVGLAVFSLMFLVYSIPLATPP